MRRLLAPLLLSIPLIAMQAQSVLPPPAGAPWTAPPGCEQRLPEDFQPLTNSERGSLYLRSLIGTRALAFTAIRATWNQALNAPDEWGRSGRGYGYRLASAFGQSAVTNTVESGVAFALNEDNRYFVSGKQGVGARLKYAITNSFLSRRQNGTRSVSISGLVGPAAGAGVSRLWQPAGSRSAGDALESFSLTIGIRVGVNVARELLPNSLRKMLP